MEKLTPRQQKVLEFIVGYLDGHGYPPTLRDIAGFLKINGTLGVMKHLDALERKGFIRKDSGASRGITLTGHVPQAVSLPVVGVVKAGLPQPAVEDIEGYFSIDSSQLKSGGAFFLRVKGDSMINDAILEGDLALVRPQATAENGDIVVAMIDDEATLKRFYRRKDHICLRPANPNYDDIIIHEDAGEEVAIIGKVVGVYRPLE
jgi:repressor LexA